MKWLEVSIIVTHDAEEAVADILSSAGAKGVVIDDPQLINHLRDHAGWELCSIPEQYDNGSVTISAYYADDGRLQGRLAAIESELDMVEERIGAYRLGKIRFRAVSEEDWAEQWKQYFHTIRVGKSLVIKPSWEKYDAEPGEKVIEIDPGMAFGTGTHHTTCMCMERLEAIIEQDERVFDVGTGSGILSVAAVLLGAGEVRAVDIDPVAVRVATENVIKNGLQQKIDVKEGNLLSGVEGRADIIIANILADVIIEMLPEVPHKLTAGGRFLASGIISERIADVQQAAAEAGLQVEQVTERAGWAVIQMSRG